MTAKEIKAAIDAGKNVYWNNKSYQVIKGKGDYYIKASNGHMIGLTWDDGTTLNGNPKDFFVESMKNIKEYHVYVNETYGSHDTYSDSEMRKNVIEPNLGKNYDAYIMFKSDGLYDKMIQKYASNTTTWKNIYRSSNYQGYAVISPDKKVIRAGIQDGPGVVGAIYIKK
jgi:hypothetical protein